MIKADNWFSNLNFITRNKIINIIENKSFLPYLRKEVKRNLKNFKINIKKLKEQHMFYNKLKEQFRENKNIKIFDIEIKTIYPGAIICSSFFETIETNSGLSMDTFLNAPYIPGSAIKGAFKRSIYRDLNQREIVFSSDEFIKLKFLDGILKIDKPINLSDVIDIVSFCKHENKSYDEDLLFNILEIFPQPFFNFRIIENISFRTLLIIEKIENIKLTKEESSVISGTDLLINYIYTIEYNNNFKKLEKLIKKSIIDTFSVIGIGAKTSVGYGYFEVLEVK